MEHSPDKLISALKRVYVLFSPIGLTVEELRDLRACVEIARACGAFEKKQVTQSAPTGVIYNDQLHAEYCHAGDALADIDAGVDDVFDKLEND